MGFLPGFGTTEMLIVGIIALVLFGKNLPKTARNMGRSFAAMREGFSDVGPTDLLIVCVVLMLLLIGFLFLQQPNVSPGRSF